ncbi:hypothetical protein [Kitasatospora sp. NPDC059599]|uniref:hypothetical protein n=1 Tax=Kitasatospora sp. NPDC059599 TaxID=3346880 RepID=UPI0036CCC570
MSPGRATRLGRLSGAAALTFALACGGVAVGAAPAVAAPLPMDQCTTTSGVVLAVDFGRWGGPLLRSCGTTPTTGYALLNQGGWKTTGTGHDGPAFICRIGYGGFQGGKQFPTPDQEKCVLTPPATAYWSYWHADPGRNTWSYSQLGAMLYQPKPGSVDLWIFGGTDIEGTEGRPAFSPDSVRALNAGPGGQPADPGHGTAGGSGGGSGNGGSGGSGSGSTSGGAGTTGGSGSGGSTGTTGGSGTGRAPAPARPPAGGARPPAPVTPPGNGTAGTPEDGITPPGAPEPTPVPATPVPVDPPTAAPTDTPSDRPTEQAAAAAPTATPAVPGGVVNADPVADTPHDSGSMVPAVVGSVLVVVLGVATVVTARRRRRQAE